MPLLLREEATASLVLSTSNPSNKQSPQWPKEPMQQVPSGVRSQNNDSAATVNRSKGQIRCSEANPATTPVNRGLLGERSAANRGKLLQSIWYRFCFSH